MSWKIIIGGIIVLLVAAVAIGSLRHRSPTEIASQNEETAACPDPLVLTPPVDLANVTSVLYPGQVRGGDFKRHGGFRFDSAVSNEIEVTAPMAAVLAAASRYIERGEVQYLLDFLTDCGIRYRFDHLRVLAPNLAAAIEELPPAKVDDSRTSNISEKILVAKGEVIATAVGANNNVFVDFGVYGVNSLAPFQNPLSNPLCWLDLLPAADVALLKSLPAGDGQSDKQSEYCH